MQQLTLGTLIFWARDNLLTSKPELFVQGNSVCVSWGGRAAGLMNRACLAAAARVPTPPPPCNSLCRRPGILVLVNDVDWELRCVWKPGPGVVCLRCCRHPQA